MAHIRNMYSLIGSRNFTLLMHEQRFKFFSAKDVKNGVMDDWIKLVKIKQCRDMMMIIVLCLIFLPH